MSQPCFGRSVRRCCLPARRSSPAAASSRYGAHERGVPAPRRRRRRRPIAIEGVSKASAPRRSRIDVHGGSVISSRSSGRAGAQDDAAQDHGRPRPPIVAGDRRRSRCDRPGASRAWSSGFPSLPGAPFSERRVRSSAAWGRPTRGRPRASRRRQVWLAGSRSYPRSSLAACSRVGLARSLAVNPRVLLIYSVRVDREQTRRGFQDDLLSLWSESAIRRPRHARWRSDHSRIASSS